MSSSDLFPSYSPEEVFERVRRVWDIDSPYPMPKRELHCPVCQEGEWQIRFWRFFERSMGGAKYRCDISMKCTICSNVTLFGIPVPKETFEMQAERDEPIHWREVKANIMRGHSSKTGQWETIEVDGGV